MKTPKFTEIAQDEYDEDTDNTIHIKKFYPRAKQLKNLIKYFWVFECSKINLYHKLLPVINIDILGLIWFIFYESHSCVSLLMIPWSLFHNEYIGMAKYFILMGDVIGSRRLYARKLQRQLKNLLSACNQHLKAGILSPYTTTLGDEFQGIAMSLRATAESIFFLEETVWTHL